MAINQYDYYEDENQWGDYQYVTLSDIVNNFMLMYVGDDKLINNVPRYNVLFHAKRGLQEIHYDSLKEIKAIEIDISEDLQMVLPEDYVDYVRISWIDDRGNFRPMLHNHKTVLARSYLQDHEYEILFDDEGAVLEGFPNTYSQTLPENNFRYPFSGASYRRYRICDDAYDGIGATSGRFGLETSMANINGWFNINKRAGVINFSSDIEARTIVLEYISDGLEYADADDIKIHKFAEEALYNYIKWCLLNNKINIQEYVVRRAKKDFFNSRRLAKGRIQQLRYNELVQAIRGRDKWIK